MGEGRVGERGLTDTVRVEWIVRAEQGLSREVLACVSNFLSQDSPRFRRAFWAFLSAYLCNKEIKNPSVPDLPQSKTDGSAEGDIIFSSPFKAAERCITFFLKYRIRLLNVKRLTPGGNRRVNHWSISAKRCERGNRPAQNFSTQCHFCLTREK